MKRGTLPPASISVRLVWPYLRLLDAKGMGLNQADITAWLVDPNARIDHQVVIEMMLESIERENDPARGLKAAMLVEPEDREPLEQAARGASTLEGAYLRLCRWFPILNSASQLTLRRGRECCELRYEVVRGSPEPPSFADSVISWLARFTCQYAGIDESELEFHFTQAPPTYADQYAQYWSGPVRFSRAFNALVLPTRHLNAPLPQQSPTLTRAYSLRAEQLLEELGYSTDSMTVSVRQLVSKHLDKGVVTMRWVADHLQVSAPTLRRRLRDEQTTFSKIVDTVRVELADRKLLEGKESVTEVATALGFANASAFDRAFKRWRGMAPSEYRARAGATGRDPTPESEKLDDEA